MRKYLLQHNIKVKNPSTTFSDTSNFADVYKYVVIDLNFYIQKIAAYVAKSNQGLSYVISANIILNQKYKNPRSLE